MNSSPVRKFCESRYRWPIVATATALVALAAILPQADEYYDNRNSRSGLSEELVRASDTAAALPEYEERAEAVNGELAALELRAVDEASLAAYRSRLVDLVRESGCQIRQIEVGAATHRPWREGDDPRAEPQEGLGKTGATGFSLERRSVLLAVDGAMPAIHDLLARLEQERTLSHPHRLQLQPAAAGGETVMLELELWLYSLSRTPI
jgi:hypothetical protein